MLKKIKFLALFIICFVLLNYRSFCQTEGSTLLNYQMLAVHDWKADSSWFGDKHIKLIALPKACIPVERGWGERICFDEDGSFYYFYVIDCPVGETLYSVKSIVVENNLMIVEHASYYWTESKIKYKRTKYKLSEITQNQIYLKRVH